MKIIEFLFQVAYVRLDDVRSFFGFTGLTAEADPESYSFLCPDSHLQPLNSENPCTWISKPWSAIASQRKHAEKVQELFQTIDINSSWQTALLQLLESYHVNVTSLDFPMTIDDYLDKSSGYQSAHSFAACNPPRQIVYCTSTLIEFSKCSWLQEVSNVYGIEPNVQCLRGENLFRCLDNVAKGVADIVNVNQDQRFRSEINFNLTSILYEHSSNFDDNYVTVAVVKANSKLRKFKDLRGRRACFPAQEGAAYLSVAQTLTKLQLSSDNCTSSAEEFFSSNSCYGKVNNCNEKYQQESGALRCLNEIGDVAFMDLSTFKNLTDKSQSKYHLISPFCEVSSDSCYLSYTSRGVFLTDKSTSQMRIDEIVNTLKTMDEHFGKQKFRSGNIPFGLFGPFDNQKNVLFNDKTDGLKCKDEFHNKKRERNLETYFNEIFKNYHNMNCKNSASRNFSSVIVALIIIFTQYFFITQ
jgi:Transferrin